MDEFISVNQIFHNTEEDKLYRILWISPMREFAYWIELDSTSRIPKLADTAEIENHIKTERFVKKPEIYNLVGDLTTQEKEQRDRLWNLMKTALLDEPDIYDRKKRRVHLEAIEKKSRDKKGKLIRISGKILERRENARCFHTCL